MIINPVTLTMSKHELLAIQAAAQKTYGHMKGDTSQKRVLEIALDTLQEWLVETTR